MKIRTDYVSNSSSSSFVVVLPKDYEFKKFIKDVVKGTVAIKDDDWKPEDIADTKARNLRNLDYCLNTHELLFLGSLVTNYVRRTIKGKKKVKEWLENEKKFSQYDFHKTRLLEESEDKLVVEFPQSVRGITVPHTVMEGSVRQWQWGGRDDPKTRPAVVEAIMECASTPFVRYTREDHSGLYEITLNTILNTEALLEAKKELVLDKRCSDLGKLKKVLAEGNRIFGIEVHHEGDGQDSTSIYALGGWDSDALKYANVQVLDCECG